ncbi:hypothetical protein SAMN05444000_1156 [Shimia gijangensis]|uniref:Sulfotransferase family protein n=1 Tax=Shimia gijangensis TaxID=1470563 RepID=A0A1M6N1C9_9RHOB|nr:hypothetical protein [Shimia gijangensis]SHJ89529.1 hypothetical protein SAMN05444000_1156 [Shimia gijangensis]
MQVALHTGAHFTDDDRLLKSLGKNRDMLAERGVFLPKPRSYRRQVRDLLNDARSAPLSHSSRDSILSGLKGVEIVDPDRIIMSNSNFFGVPRLAVSDNKYYPTAESRLQDFCSVFAEEEIDVFLAIRNPATFLPALLAGCPEDTIDQVTDSSAPTALRWSELVMRLRQSLPNVSFTVWCNEDTPLIWEQLLRELSTVEATLPMEGGSDLLGEIMSESGMKRYGEYLQTHPGMTEIQKRRVMAAFLDKFALEDEVEEELDMPGWTEEYVDALTEIYDEDVYEISRIEGVSLISP